jgi:heptosyltransferase-3
VVAEAYSSEVPLREVWESNLLWARRQSAFLAQAVDDPSCAFTPPKRLGAFLNEGSRALLSVGKSALRHSAITLSGTFLRRKPLPTVDKPPKRVLLVVHDLMGDAVLALPLIKQMVDALPGARVSVLTGRGPAPLLRDNVPEGVRVIETAAAERKLSGAGRLLRRLEPLDPDVVVIAYCHGLCPAALFLLGGAPVVSWTEDNGMGQRLWGDLVTHPVEKNFRKAESAALLDLLAPLGLKTRLERPRVVAGEKARERRAKLLREAGTAEGEYVVVHFEADDRFKFWPADRMAEIVRRIAATGRTVFLDGSRQGRIAWERCGGGAERCHSVHQLLDTSELAALLETAVLFVGCDSGPSHVAQAVGCPALLLFGMTEPHRWGPLPRLPGEEREPKATVVAAAAGDWLEEESRGLPHNQGMRFLSVDRVWESVESCLCR